MTPDVAVYRVVGRTEAEGPGTRAAVWVHGCSIRCPGCFNAHLWPERPASGSAEELARELTSSPAIEGITFLGGEPFEQAEGLAHVATRARAAGLSVMAFTGHLLEELRARDDPATQALIAATDLLVDGPYDRSRPDPVRPWVGSSNQRFHFLTARYAHLEHHIATGATEDRLEVRIAPDGRVFINGMASRPRIRELSRSVRSATKNAPA